MNLAEPHRLWWLLVLPVLWWLSLPPRPRRSVWTPHLEQWQAARASLRRRPPRLSGARLVLACLAAAAAIVAHAEPALRGGPGAQRLVVLLDASASMAARGADDRPAFALACDALRAGLLRVPEHVDVTLLRCAEPLVRRHGASARALHDVGGPGGRLVADLAGLAREIAEDPATAVWTLTDGQGQAELPRHGAVTLVPRRGANAAVAAVRAIDRWPLPALTLAVDVVAWGPSPADVVVTVGGAVAAVPAQQVRVASGEVGSATFELAREAGGGAVDVRVAMPGDVLPDDDRWSALLPPLPAPRIAVLASAEDGPFAHVAAEALAGEVGGSVVAAGPGDEVGLVLVDGGVVAAQPGRSRLLCFGSLLAADPEPETLVAPRVDDWDRTGPLTEGLDLSELQIAVAFPRALPPGEPFLWAVDAAGLRVPLAVVCGGDTVASVHVAFRLQDSNLPLLPAFPQLLRRAFVRTFGAAARHRVTTPPLALGEQDLRDGAEGTDRPLPGFATADRPLAVPFLLAALFLLALRTLVR